MLRIEEDGGIAVVRIDRPEARNALNAETLSALTDTARTLGRRSDISAVILTGTDSFFSAGIDLKAEPRASATLIERRDAARAGPDLCRAWEAIEAVTIVAIEGYCVGGACALALACDFRIMAAGAMMRLPEVPLGMNMSWGTLPRLVALIGPARAKAFALFGEPAHVSECLAWGLADRSAEQGEALTEARQWAERVAALPPLPARMTKEAINASANALSAAASFMDRDQFLLTSLTDDFGEGVAAFLEKRAGRFRGD
jgi:enoyl-CoA hydratase